MRIFAQSVSLVLLVFAVIAGLVDAIRSVAAGGPLLTPLGELWSNNSPNTLLFLQDLSLQYLPAWVWDPGVDWILAQPACLVFLSLSLVFYLLGYRRARPAGRFAA